MADQLVLRERALEHVADDIIQLVTTSPDNVAAYRELMRLAQEGLAFGPADGPPVDPADVNLEDENVQAWIVGHVGEVIHMRGLNDAEVQRIFCTVHNFAANGIERLEARRAEEDVVEQPTYGHSISVLLFLSVSVLNASATTLWYYRTEGTLQWNVSLRPTPSRMYFNVKLSAFCWAAFAQRLSTGPLTILHRFRCPWLKLERAALMHIFPGFFFLQAVGKLLAYSDIGGAGVTVTVGTLWLIFVGGWGPHVFHDWRMRSRADRLVHKRCIKCWGIVVALACAQSLCATKLIWMGTAPCLRWVDISFKLFQMLWLFALYFTLVHNCDIYSLRAIRVCRATQTEAYMLIPLSATILVLLSGMSGADSGSVVRNGAALAHYAALVLSAPVFHRALRQSG